MAYSASNRLTGVLFAGALLTAIASLPASAQAPDGAAPGNGTSLRQVTLNLENADIRYALKLLFDSAGANYSLDQTVQGTVTVSLTNVPFGNALEAILRSADSANPLTYRVEANVYYVIPRQVAPDGGSVAPPEPSTPAPPKLSTVKIPLNFIDVQTVAQALGLGLIEPPLSGYMSGNVGPGGMMGTFGGYGGVLGGFGGGLGNFGNGFGTGFGNGSGLGSGFGTYGSGFGDGTGNGFNPGSGSFPGSGSLPGNGGGIRR